MGKKQMLIMSIISIFIIIAILSLVVFSYKKISSPLSSPDSQKDKNSSIISSKSPIQGATIEEDKISQSSTENQLENEDSNSKQTKKTSPLFPEIDIFDCTPELRDSALCISEYKVVCGWYSSERVSCDRSPCVQLFADECSACSDFAVMYWNDGDCPLDN